MKIIAAITPRIAARNGGKDCIVFCKSHGKCKSYPSYSSMWGRAKARARSPLPRYRTAGIELLGGRLRIRQEAYHCRAAFDARRENLIPIRSHQLGRGLRTP